MRFMIIRKADKDTEAYVMPSEELLTAMLQYMQELAKAGVLLGGEGLHPTSKSSRIKFSGGKPTVIDGPFAEAKELIAGYTLIQVKSREEALEWAKRWPALDGNGSVELELRQLFENEDFGPELTPELIEHEAVLRAQTAAPR
ncbi:YciI family protein [Andreprevotia chitinilytica]|uniref:YciI family protein n=1 Tax=Andreprevotia chitinilytica TaxID=396808 RepID=UPI00054EC845|nr:YciI family protein [Andreprevotia chitinilytica]